MTPRYVQAFRDALLSAPAEKFSIRGLPTTVVASPGVHNSRWLRYRDAGFQLLERSHEYTFAIPGADAVETLAQFYRNSSGYWRLFAYNKKGMLFSLNLTLARNGSRLLTLTQKLKSFTRNVTREERQEAMDTLSETLRALGLRVSEDRVVDLGDFDSARGAFVRTTARRFMRDFMTIALVKGHYMGNKGYELPGLPRAAQPAPNTIEASLVAKGEVLKQDGAFDPTDESDAREKTRAQIALRRGQAAFRRQLLAAYERRCAISGCDFEGALEAAHIIGYRGEHTNSVTNGLLLRADLHTLFDLRYIAVDSKTMTVLLSNALRGTVYEEFDGQQLFQPDDPRLRPSAVALDRHRRETGL